MFKIHNFFKNINVLNGVLILIVSVAAYDVVTPFIELKMPSVLPSIRKPDTEQTGMRKPKQYASIANYVVVSEQNLFHPERRIPPEKKVERETVVIPKPDLVLYGTLITDTISVAYIEDRKAPYSTPGRGTRQRQFKRGDSINGYVLQEIAADRIVLVRDGEKLIVSLSDKDRPRVRETASTASLASSSPGGAIQPRSAVPARSQPGRSAAAISTAPAPADQAANTQYSYAGAVTVGAATGQTPGSAVPAAPNLPASTTPPASSVNPGTSPQATNPPPTTPPASSVGQGTSPEAPANPVTDPFTAEPGYQAPPPAVAKMIEKLPPRSHALSDMLTITPDVVRKVMGRQ